MLQLVIGNKNYSSWSMRPWVLMRQFGIAFEEIKLRFDFAPGSAFYRDLAQYTPAARVPVLLIDGFAVWDTLAIAETLADLHPGMSLWPTEFRARARARSLAAEMHAGFSALRSHCPMNIEASLPEVGARTLTRELAVELALGVLLAALVGLIERDRHELRPQQFDHARIREDRRPVDHPVVSGAAERMAVHRPQKQRPPLCRRRALG